MNILHISFSFHGTNEEVSLRFYPGTNQFRKAYLLEATKKDLKNIPLAISYLFTGQPHNYLSQSQLTLCDQSGDIWHLKRIHNDFFCIKNDQPHPYSEAQALLNRIWQSDEHDDPTLGKPFAISHYYILPIHDDFQAKPFAELDKEDDIKIKFLQEHIREICDACEHSFASPQFAKESTILHLGEKLEPLAREYKGLIKQYQSLYRDHNKAPRAYLNEWQALSDQIEIMKKIAEICHFLLQSNPSITHLKQKHQQVEQQIIENLQFCKLDEIPTIAAPPDWNVPLQCLCYINVLERLTPVLKETLTQFNRHFHTATNIRNNEKSFDSLMTALSQQLQQALLHLSHFDKSANHPEAAASAMALTWYDKIKQKLGSDSPAMSELSEKLLGSQLREALQYALTYIGKLKANPSQLAVSAEPLEEFMASSAQKLANLKKHWQKICEEFAIPADQSMHELLQFILQFNELFILRQKRKEIEEILTEKNKKIYELKRLIQMWYEKTGSQKQTPLNNHQIIISEAQNIIRYRSDKEQKLQQLEQHRIAIEVNNQLKSYIEGRAKALQTVWGAAFKEANLALIAPNDPRLAPLLEKYNLLKALVSIQDNTINDHSIHLFAPEWYYTPICTWSFLSNQLRKEQKKQFINKLASLPPGSLHIFFLTDAELAKQAHQLGIGKVLLNRTIKAHRDQPSAASLPRPGAKGSPSSTLPPLSAQSMARKQPNHKPYPSEPSILNSKAQAVVDILNGAKHRSPLK